MFKAIEILRVDDCLRLGVQARSVTPTSTNELVGYRVIEIYVVETTKARTSRSEVRDEVDDLSRVVPPIGDLECDSEWTNSVFKRDGEHVGKALDIVYPPVVNHGLQTLRVTRLVLVLPH